MKLEQIKQWDLIEYRPIKYDDSRTEKAIILNVFEQKPCVRILGEFMVESIVIDMDQITRILYNIGDPFKQQENPTDLCTLSEALVKLETGEWKEAVDVKGDIIRLREESKKLAFRSMNSSDYKNVGYMRFDGSREWSEYKKPEEELKPCFCGKLPELIKGSNDAREFCYYNCDSTIDENFNHFLMADNGGDECEARKNWNELMERIDKCYGK